MHKNQCGPRINASAGCCHTADVTASLRWLSTDSFCHHSEKKLPSWVARTGATVLRGYFYREVLAVLICAECVTVYSSLWVYSRLIPRLMGGMLPWYSLTTEIKKAELRPTCSGCLWGSGHPTEPEPAAAASSVRAIKAPIFWCF